MKGAAVLAEVVVVVWLGTLSFLLIAAGLSDGIRWLRRRKEVVGEADRDGDLGEGSFRPHSELAGERSPGAAFPTPPIPGRPERGNDRGYFDPSIGQVVRFYRWWDEQDRRFLARLRELTDGEVYHVMSPAEVAQLLRPEACWLCREVGEENCPDHARSDA
jgi:hypothetical protein